MRSVCFRFIALLALVGVPAPGPQADDKTDQKSWEEQEKELAELDRQYENEELSIELKKQIAELGKELQGARRIEIFRLWGSKQSPAEGKDGKPVFHEYPILTKGAAETAEARKEIASFLGKTLHWNWTRIALCFNPRHGVRVVTGKRTLDFLICFECYRVRVFEGEEQVLRFALSHPKDNPIERLLQGAEKKVQDCP